MRAILGTKRWIIESTESEDSPNSNEDGQEENENELLEPWQDFLRRTTRLIERLASAAGLEEWSVTWRRRQWKWADNLISSQTHKWSYKTNIWRPDHHGNVRGFRSQGRPNKRWEDDIENFCMQLENNMLASRELTKDRKTYKSLEKISHNRCRFSRTINKAKLVCTS